MGVLLFVLSGHMAEASIVSVAPGWYQDGQHQLRYWNGSGWGLQTGQASGTTGIEARYRVVGQPGISLSHSDFGHLATVGAQGEYRTAQALELLLEKYSHAWLFHSVRIDGQAWDIDHVLIVGRVVFFIDAKNWRGDHDYLFRFQSEYAPPPAFADGPHDARFMVDGVLRWDRSAEGQWESFPGSVVRLRGLAERFATEAGIQDPSQYRFVPLLVISKDNVTTHIDSDRPTWFQFTHLGELDAKVAEILRVEDPLADGHEPTLHSMFTKFQANAITPVESATTVRQASQQVAPYTYGAATQTQHAIANGQSVSTGGGNGLAVPAMIIGIVSIFMPLIVGVVVGGLGLGLSIAALNRAGRTGGHLRGVAVAGLVTSIIGLVLIL